MSLQKVDLGNHVSQKIFCDDNNPVSNTASSIIAILYNQTNFSCVDYDKKLNSKGQDSLNL